MRANIDRLGGLIHSQRVLLGLIEAGLAREAAYALVQQHAAKVWRGDADFLSALLADEQVRALLPEAKVRGMFDLAPHTRHTDTIFRRVFGDA
jgi:adenylosuccinate lyase